EKIRPEPWIDVPPLHKLGGDRNDRRTLVLSLMQQASQDILTEQLNKMREPARQKREQQKAVLLARRTKEALHQRQQEARQAWEVFSRFARKRALTSGEQKRIESIVKTLGSWRVVDRWESWEDARSDWTGLWEKNQSNWVPIIRSLK